MKAKSAIVGGVTATIGTVAVIADGIPKIIGGVTSTLATITGTTEPASTAATTEGGGVSVLGKLDESLAKVGFAPSCDAYWIERNQLYNLHGRCFNSALGQAVFDNTDCTPGATEIPQTDIDYALEMRRRETRSGCSVDTTRSSVEVQTMRGPITIGMGAYRFAGVELAGPKVATDTTPEPAATVSSTAAEAAKTEADASPEPAAAPSATPTEAATDTEPTTKVAN